MSVFAYAMCAIYLVLGVAEIVAFAVRARLFGEMSRKIMASCTVLLLACVVLNLEYLIGTFLGSWAFFKEPILGPAVYGLFVLAAVTLSLRYVDERRWRKMELPKP